MVPKPSYFVPYTLADKDLTNLEFEEDPVAKFWAKWASKKLLMIMDYNTLNEM